MLQANHRRTGSGVGGPLEAGRLHGLAGWHSLSPGIGMNSLFPHCSSQTAPILVCQGGKRREETGLHTLKQPLLSEGHVALNVWLHWCLWRERLCITGVITLRICKPAPLHKYVCSPPFKDGNVIDLALFAILLWPKGTFHHKIKTYIYIFTLTCSAF